MGDAPLPTSVGRPKVAVIGSGLAGLTTAYLLSEAGLDVWLIEKVCDSLLQPKRRRCEAAPEPSAAIGRTRSRVRPSTS